jgi:hypothetical protein
MIRRVLQETATLAVLGANIALVCIGAPFITHLAHHVGG